MNDTIARAYSSIIPSNIVLPNLETMCCTHSQPHEQLDEVFTGDRRNFTYNFIEGKKHDDLHEEHTAEPTSSLREYTSFSFPVNSAMHNYSNTGTVKPSQKQDVELAKKIENDLTPYQAKKPFTVYTGLRYSPFKAATNIGGYFHAHMPSFVSTSTDLHTAEFFAAHDHDTEHNPSLHHGDIEPGSKHVLKIHVVPGTNIASVKKFSKYESENEMLLNRGYNVMINPRPTYLPPKGQGLSPTYMWDTWVTRRTPRKL